MQWEDHLSFSTVQEFHKKKNVVVKGNEYSFKGDNP